MMLALPGSAYLYQGEELGLPEHTTVPDDLRQDPIWFRSERDQVGRDGCRIPMPWIGDAPRSGFLPDRPDLAAAAGLVRLPDCRPADRGSGFDLEHVPRRPAAAPRTRVG